MIKRMRLMGLKRDYIFSFVLYPGRTLTPACIAEVEQGKIGPDVGPATSDEVVRFIESRLTSHRPALDDEFATPLSSLRIRQALRWFGPGQADLFRDETQITEFKIIFSEEKSALLGYAKTLAAFANNRGGYLFFGVSDNGDAVSFDAERFRKFEWDRFGAIVRDYFAPSPDWEHTVYEDGELKVGVLYVYEAKAKPVIAVKTYNNSVCEGRIYYRYRGASQEIKAGDLQQMLVERDDRVRERWATASKPASKTVEEKQPSITDEPLQPDWLDLVIEDDGTPTSEAQIWRTQRASPTSSRRAVRNT